MEPELEDVAMAYLEADGLEQQLREARKRIRTTVQVATAAGHSAAKIARAAGRDRTTIQHARRSA